MGFPIDKSVRTVSWAQGAQLSLAQLDQNS
jgi:hypothetical protein